MVIEICSQKRAVEMTGTAREKTAVISITSKESPDVVFSGCTNIEGILHLKFNDITEEYDEEGIPYGCPVPESEDLAGLKEFVDHLACSYLVIHCWEGTSRSAAVAAAVYEYRLCRDTLRTHQRFAPNRLVYELACREMGIRRGSLRYSVQGETIKRKI